MHSLSSGVVSLPARALADFVLNDDAEELCVAPLKVLWFFQPILTVSN